MLPLANSKTYLRMVKKAHFNHCHAWAPLKGQKRGMVYLLVVTHVDRRFMEYIFFGVL